MSDSETPMSHEQTAREAIVARLEMLYSQFAAEEALQFEGKWWRWGDFARTAEALAGHLAAAQSREGDPVGVVVRQRPSSLAGQLAVMSLGRGVEAMTPLQGDAALAADVDTLTAGVVAADAREWRRPGFGEAVAGRGALGLVLGDDGGVAVAVPARGVPRSTEPRFAAALSVLTSGTTGPPKRLPVAWANLAGIGGPPRPAVSGRGAMILSLPLVTLGGMASVGRLVFSGRPMAMMERFDVFEWAALVKQHRPKTMGAPPPVLRMILDAGISQDHFDSVEAYVTGSAPVSPEIAVEFHKRYGIPVLVSYGATEFLSAVTGWSLDLWREFGAAKLGSVGRAHPGVGLRVVDPDSGDPVAAGETGLLEVDPPRRAGNLAPGWLRTADRAHLDEDGFLWIHGRADDVIIRGGFKVDLVALERSIAAHPEVAAAAVVGLDDERLGTVPGAVVTVRPGSAVTADVVVEWLRDKVAPYAVPTVLRIVDEIPLTPTLKPDRRGVAALLG